MLRILLWLIICCGSAAACRFPDYSVAATNEGGHGGTATGGTMDGGGTTGSAGLGTGGAGGAGEGGGAGAEPGPACPTGAPEPCTCVVRLSTATPYLFCDAAATWSSADGTCQLVGMQLVIIKSSVEDVWVATHAAQNFTDGSDTTYWIGASDMAAEGQWRWVDGTSFWTGTGFDGSAVDNGFENWDMSEPNATGNCGTYKGTRDAWDDTVCSTPHVYVCEHPG